MQSPASPMAIEALKARYPRLPEELINLVREATEIELSCGGYYLRLYGPDLCAEMDDAYEISKHIPGAIPVGDNGGGEAVFYLEGPVGWGVYRCGYGALDPEEVKWIARTLRALLCDGTEAARIGGCLA